MKPLLFALGGVEQGAAHGHCVLRKMRMRVVIQLRLAEALELQSGRPPMTALSEVLRIVADVGAHLQPVHAGASDPLLAPYFFVDLADSAAPEQLISRLMACDAVIASYPEPSIPSP